MPDKYKVKSLAKAVDVLECFTAAEPELSLTDIVSKLNLPKATVYNILSTFEQKGYVKKDSQTKKYSLGLSMLYFGYVINSQLSYRKVFHDYISEIARQCSEICYIAIPHEQSIVYIDAAFPRGYGNIRSITGEQAPMHCTGLGKALLAHMPPKDQEAVIENGLISFTEKTITDPQTFRDELQKIVRLGYAVDHMEHEHGISCVAVPVFGADGSPIAAVSVSGPTPRFYSDIILKHYQTIRKILQPLQGTL